MEYLKNFIHLFRIFFEFFVWENSVKFGIFMENFGKKSENRDMSQDESVKFWKFSDNFIHLFWIFLLFIYEKITGKNPLKFRKNSRKSGNVWGWCEEFLEIFRQFYPFILNFSKNKNKEKRRNFGTFIWNSGGILRKVWNSYPETTCQGQSGC